MAREIILDNEYASLWFHTDEKIVEHKIKKFIFGDKFRNMLLMGTETMRKYKGKKWLSDDRHIPVLLKEDLEWGNSEWISKTIKVGWRYWAVLQPEDAFGKLNIDEQIRRFSSKGIITQYFLNREEALDWLKTQK